MEALKEKLNSRRGASILLALLFMLMCILVAASVVMAASSNAGKIKSNKEEQQKYLTLSSAVNFLVDELESVEYVGKYEYKYDSKLMLRGTDGNLYDPGASTIPGLPTNPDDPDDPDETEPVVVTTYTYTLQPGTWKHQDKTTDSTANPSISTDDWKDGRLENLLPMNKYLDYLFKKEFGNKYGEDHEEGLTYKRDYYYKCNIAEPLPPPDKYTQTLTLTVNDATAPGDLPNQQVRIEVELKEDGRINLKATLYEKTEEKWNPTSYQMVAMLRTQSGKWPVNVINLTATKDGDITPFKPVRWELAYIYKVEDNMKGKAGIS